MKQKTAIRQLIDEIKLVAGLWDNPENEIDGAHCFKVLLKRAEELEPVNERHIIDAYDDGNPNGFIVKTGEQYFNETFN